MIEILIYFGAVIFLTFCSGYCSSSETALFSLSPHRIQAYRTSKNPKEQLIAKLVLKPRDLLVTVFMLNTLVNILLQNVVSSGSGTGGTWWEKIAIPFLLTLIFGEIIPKNFGMENNVWLSNKVISSINFLHRCIEPIRTLTVKITAPISRIMFFYLKREETISKDEMTHVLRTSEELGVLEPFEARLVRGYLDLQGSQVRELMRPREDILFYDINDPLTKLQHLMMEEQVTRIPVCDQSLDNCLGMISSIDFFLNSQKLQTPEQLKRLLKRPFFVPETTSARVLLKRFQEKNQVLALFVDEYGSSEGLITFEDLVEEVVGEIEDIRDTHRHYTQSGEGQIIASGKLELDELNDIFQTDLKSAHGMISVGGWLSEQLGTIPKGGTEYRYPPLLFQVLASDPHRIRRIFIRKLDQEEEKKL